MSRIIYVSLTLHCLFFGIIFLLASFRCLSCVLCSCLQTRVFLLLFGSPLCGLFSLRIIRFGLNSVDSVCIANVQRMFPHHTHLLRLLDDHDHQQQPNFICRNKSRTAFFYDGTKHYSYNVINYQMNFCARKCQSDDFKMFGCETNGTEKKNASHNEI